MPTITIPENLIKSDDLVAISRKDYENFLELKSEVKEVVSEDDVLRWSREAKKLKKAGKLPQFNELVKKEYPVLAKKYRL